MYSSSRLHIDSMQMIMLQNKALKFIYRLCELLFRKKKPAVFLSEDRLLMFRAVI